ncbi:MAG: FtsX-like permease family protein [Solirubrobacterales bacterium]
MITSLRALLKVARRNIARSPWRSALIVVLIMLPVGGMVGLATVMVTITPSAERTTVQRMGMADVLVYPGPGGSEARLVASLPAGSRIEPNLWTGGNLVLPGYAVQVNVRSEDLGGLARGMLDLVGGRLPVGPDEIAINEPVARLTGASIGDRIEVRELGPRTIVGLIEDPLGLDGRMVLADPSLAAAAIESGEAGWLVGLPAGTDPQSLEIVASGLNLAALDPASAPPFNVTTRAEAIQQASGLGPTTIVMGTLALVDGALVAAAAFAVGVRRRQRELGLLAASGASPRQLAASVLAEGALLGTLGALLGAALGIAGALALCPFLDGLTNHRNPPLVLDLPVLAAAVAMGLVAALLAALAPAWSAARTSVLAALSGRRPPIRSAGRSLAAGLVVLGIAVSLTTLGAAIRLQDPGTLSLLLLLGGAVLGTLGLGACAPWLLERLDIPGIGLPPATRIALRDTARARSRNGPIVTALLAAAGATVALAAYAASLNAAALARWQPVLRPDQVMIAGPGYAQAGPAAAREVGAVAAASIVSAIGPDRVIWIGAGDDGPSALLSTAWVALARPELVRALGLEAASAALDAGRVVLLWPRAQEGQPFAGDPPDVAEATIHIMSRSDGTAVDDVVVPATVLATGLSRDDLPGALISEATAANLGLTAGQSEAGPTDRYLIRLDHPISGDDLAAVGRVAAQYPDTTAFASQPPDLAGGLFRLVLIAGSLVFTLTVTAIAVALGEAESRPEQRTLLAIGADPRLRRRITAARAGVIAILGGLLAVPAGLLPVWGLLASRGAPLVVPVPEILAMVGGLPLLAIGAALLLARPIPTWSAFRGD